MKSQSKKYRHQNKVIFIAHCYSHINVFAGLLEDYNAIYLSVQKVHIYIKSRTT